MAKVQCSVCVCASHSLPGCEGSDGILHPGRQPPEVPSIFNPKITMYKNIIKLAAIATKDTPAAILKKTRRLDPLFAQERDLELEAYLSRRGSLPFSDFAVLFEDRYARYSIYQPLHRRPGSAARHVRSSVSRVA